MRLYSLLYYPWVGPRLSQIDWISAAGVLQKVIPWMNHLFHANWLTKRSDASWPTANLVNKKRRAYQSDSISFQLGLIKNPFFDIIICGSNVSGYSIVFIVLFFSPHGNYVVLKCRTKKKKKRILHQLRVRCGDWFLVVTQCLASKPESQLLNISLLFMADLMCHVEGNNAPITRNIEKKHIQ